MAEEFERLRFSNGVQPWQPGMDLEEGNLVMVTLSKALGASTRCILLSMYDRTTGATLDAAELGAQGTEGINHFNLVFQPDMIDWRPGVLSLIGLKMGVGGFVGESASVRETPEDFDYAEYLNVNIVNTAATGIGTFVYQPGHGLEYGQWVTNVNGEYVLGQPDDPVLRETEGRVSFVLSDSMFILDHYGYGTDQEDTLDDNFWDYDVGTELVLDADGTVTDQKPAGKPYRSLGRITSPGYFLHDQKTIYPKAYLPILDAWPTDAMLRQPADGDGFAAFLYTGLERKPGLYLNANTGKPATASISQPTRV